jgi:hypothetical protein
VGEVNSFYLVRKFEGGKPDFAKPACRAVVAVFAGK